MKKNSPHLSVAIKTRKVNQKKTPQLSRSRTIFIQCFISRDKARKLTTFFLCFISIGSQLRLSWVCDLSRSWSLLRVASNQFSSDTLSSSRVCCAVFFSEEEFEYSTWRRRQRRRKILWNIGFAVVEKKVSRVYHTRKTSTTSRVKRWQFPSAKINFWGRKKFSRSKDCKYR